MKFIQSPIMKVCIVTIMWPFSANADTCTGLNARRIQAEVVSLPLYIVGIYSIVIGLLSLIKYININSKTKNIDGNKFIFPFKSLFWLFIGIALLLWPTFVENMLSSMGIIDIHENRSYIE